MRNELATYTALRSLLQSKLDRFATTIVEDEDLLRHFVREARPFNDRELMCVFVRLQDKLLFQETIELVNRLMDECSADPESYLPPDHHHSS